VRYRRLFGVVGALGSMGSWCGRLHGSFRSRGLFGVRGPEGSERAALTWLTRASSGKARELVQVSGLGDETARFLAVKALEASGPGQ
jgi:hypothetical protein